MEATALEARALAVILAAGEGKRMNASLPKVLHRLGGQPLIEHVVQACLRAGMDRTIVVVGHRRDMVIEALRTYPIEFVLQVPQLGTGHAMQQVARHVGSFHGTCAVFLGDAPFITPATMTGLVNQHREERNAATVLTAEFEDPEGYGRIVRGTGGEVERIVEQVDASEAESQIREINSGMYCFDYTRLSQALAELATDNLQKEYYLTDTIRILCGAGERVGSLTAADPLEIFGINDFRQLQMAERVWKERVEAKQPQVEEPMMTASYSDGTYSVGADDEFEDERLLGGVHHASPDSQPPVVPGTMPPAETEASSSLTPDGTTPTSHEV